MRPSAVRMLRSQLGCGIAGGGIAMRSKRTTHADDLVRIPDIGVVLDDPPLRKQSDFDGINARLGSEHPFY